MFGEIIVKKSNALNNQNIHFWTRGNHIIKDVADLVWTLNLSLITLNQGVWIFHSFVKGDNYL